jgi:transcriptional regulator with XRE-family HTH domain
VNVPARIAGESLTSVPLAERIQSILASKDLTLYRVSQQSAALYGRSSAFFVPHNLYSDLRASSFIPSLHQIVALSRISGYRLVDWLTVFGFNVEDITRLQVLLPSKRTILLDTSLTDAEDSIPWFRNRVNTVAAPRIAPLVQMLEPTPPRRIGSLSRFSGRDFQYAKIGSEDAFAFPELAPGSIVRIDPQIDHHAGHLPKDANRIFLIEHSKGLCCCPVRQLAADVIVPVGTLFPYARIPFRVPAEARILGIVDVEIRLLLKTGQPTVPRDLARRWKPRAFVTDINLGQRLQRTRTNMNLSLREASGMSRWIAEMCGNPHYRISASSLYDYEQGADSPRDFRKIASLCSLYGLPLQLFLDATGIASKDDPAQIIPNHLLPRHELPEIATESSMAGPDAGFLRHLVEQLEDLPFFLRNSMDTIANSSKPSLDDVFWIGGEHNVFHPYLFNGFLAIVNRRRKTAFHFASKPLWQQPIYLILRRDGEYLAACCGAENGTLVVHSYGHEFHPPMVFRNHQEAEVIGQIVAVVRKLV